MNSLNLKDRLSMIFDRDRWTLWMKKYFRYVLAVLVLLAMALILSRCTAGTSADEDPMSGVYQKFSEDSNEELNALIQQYYQDFADGNVDDLQTIATPISDAEKSYIQFFSQYVEEYQNLKVYSKRGADDSSYLVSVYLHMKFKDIETTAAGLDFFYVQTNDEGKLYINNIYSSFNQANGEYELDDNIASLIAAFEQQPDVTALQAEVQQECNEAMVEDESLNTFVNVTLQDAITKWASDYRAQVAAQEAAEQQAAAEQKAAEEAAAAQAVAEQQAAEQAAAAQAAAEQQAAAEAAAAQAAAEQQAAQQQQQQQQQQAAGLAAGQQIRLTESTNIRTSMSETAPRLALAYAGEYVTVQMSYAEGWTKVTYNGQEGYVRTDILQAQVQ